MDDQRRFHRYHSPANANRRETQTPIDQSMRENYGNFRVAHNISSPAPDAPPPDAPSPPSVAEADDESTA
jgi:hypothetical protein